MLILGIDTSFYYLTLALIKDDETIDSVYERCQRNQSEIIFPKLIAMFDRNNLNGNSIDAIVIVKGPGSYTGIRIAMSIAKIYCLQKDIPLYTLSSLQLYAGLDPKVIAMDARAQRCFFAVYDKGQAIISDRILTIKEVKEVIREFPNYGIYGDGRLVEDFDNFTDITENFLNLKSQWNRVENIHLLAPEYLKEESDYGKN